MRCACEVNIVVIERVAGCCVKQRRVLRAFDGLAVEQLHRSVTVQVSKRGHDGVVPAGKGDGERILERSQGSVPLAGSGCGGRGDKIRQPVREPAQYRLQLTGQ